MWKRPAKFSLFAALRLDGKLLGRVESRRQLLLGRAIICSQKYRLLEGLMSPLDLTLTARWEAGVLSAVADGAYEANTGMFGGWAAALLLNAVLQEPAVQGSPSALTVNFTKPAFAAANPFHARGVALWTSSVTSSSSTASSSGSQ